MILAITFVVVACAAPGASGPVPSGGVTPAPTAVPTPLVLHPAPLNPEPFSFLVWLFTPIYQAFLLLLVGVHFIVRDIGIAIIVTTLIVRTGMVPLMRRQMVSMRQMSALSPEIKEIQRRFKGDRVKQQQAQSELMKERGISQAGCLVAILPLLLILPMYQVIGEGLRAVDLTPMLTVFGVQVIPLTCPPPVALHNAAGALIGYQPCLNPAIPWLGGIDASSTQQGFIPLPFELPILGNGISILAIFYTVIQLIASRMALPPHDPTVPLDPQLRTQRTMSLVLPFITLLYGHIIPVGLFIYLIVSTAYQAVQQYFTTGWGSMFPLFGWTPGFAVDHKPRFPVAVPTAPSSSTRGAGAPARPNPDRSALDRSASANATIRQRGRQGRRGRRR